MMKIGISIVLWLVAFVINPWGLVGLAATVFSVLGCIDWAKAKGLSPWWGAIGILGLIGWIVMFFIPSKATMNSNIPS